jgi:hypothetical protein
VILFAFCATSTAASILEEWRVGFLADPNKRILCERRWRDDTRASRKASRRSDGFRLPSFCRAVIRWSIFIMSGEG